MCSSDSMYRETISLPLPQVSSSHRQESRRCWRQEVSGESSAVTITGMESLSPRDIRHVFSHPPHPSLQTSSNELPAPATTPHTCSPTPAQYSPLSPHQPSPPPPPNHPHHHPLSHPQRNILSLPHHHPLWKHPPRWLLRSTLKLKSCSLNLPLSLTIAPTSQMFTGFLNTRASRLLLPPLPPPAITPCLHPLPATVHHHCVLCCYNHLPLSAPNTRTPTHRLVHLHPKPSRVSPPGQC